MMTTLETLRNEINTAETRKAELEKIHFDQVRAGADINSIDFSEEYKLSRRINELNGLIKKEERRNVTVGEGVTLHYYTDAHAYTVIARTKTTLTIQRDKATLDPNFKPNIIPGGFAGHCTNQNEQTYTYERDPQGTIQKAFWSERDGMFKVDGDLRVYNGRHECYDYNF